MRVPAHVWVGVAGVVAGCLPATSHQCETSTECGPAGSCEINGACSFPAGDCPSGRRYGEGTGPLAGQCVDDGSGIDAADVDAVGGDGGGIDATAVLPWGDGHHGDLTISIAQAQMNSFGVVRQDAAAGANLIFANRQSGGTVGSWSDNFEAGDRIMVWRTSGMADPNSSGSTAPLSVDAEVGSWYVTRVLARSADRLTIADPLPFACPADRCQVIKLPELDQVTVNLASNVHPPDWQGQWGGLVGFYANDLRLDGATIEASADGFRGAPAENTGSFGGCTALDGRSNIGGGAAKGESFVPSRFSAGAGVDPTSGRGNIHSGGGGGDCQDAGGGGGGHAGGGGSGGNDEVMRAVGGMAGVAVRYAPATHLVMGGGGGAGEDNVSAAGVGGYGGGVVWLTVRTITCTNGGQIVAYGGDGGSIGDDGAGGGAAGGLVWIRAETIIGCSLETNGGDGGTTQGSNGPGGGGGGGKIILVTNTATNVTTSVTGGSAGSNGTTPYGALAGQAGAVCGNGTLEAGETCDDGNYRPGDACTYCSE